MNKFLCDIKKNRVYLHQKQIPVTEDSLNTIEIEFDLPEEYEGLTCIAVFSKDNKNYKRTIIDGSVLIPVDVLKDEKDVLFGVYAYELNELIYSPIPTKIKVEKGSYVENSEEEETFSQSDFDRWLEQANDLYNDMQDYVESQETAEAVAQHLIDSGIIYSKEDIDETVADIYEEIGDLEDILHELNVGGGVE